MPRKILQISPFSFDHPGGVEQYAKTLQEIFPDEILTLSGGSEFPITEPVKNCPVPCIWKKGFWKNLRGISRENTSIIISHIRFAPTAWLAYWIARKNKIPYIHIEHGTGFLIHKNPFVAWVAKVVDITIGRWIIHHADHVVCVSKAGEKWVRETFDRKENISVIYRGFEFPKVERKENKVPKIGFVGRLTGLKNVSLLIESLDLIKEENWTCEIVGDGEERTNLESHTQRLGLSERIKFLGLQPHEWIIREFYPSVDIFINPSLQEGLPTTVIEALGMGCQVIATDVGGTREIEGIVFVKPSKENIQDAIYGKLKSKGNYQPITNFHLEKMALEYNHLFREIRKDTIYFLINSLEGGGAERVITTVSERLNHEKKVIIITLKAEKFFEIPAGVQHIPLSQVKHNILLFILIPFYIIRFRQILKEYNLQEGISFLEISNFIHILSRKNAIISFRTSLGFFQGIFGIIYKIFIKILYPKARYIVVGSQENKKSLTNYLKIPEEKILVIHNPIDCKKIKLLSQEPIEDNVKQAIIGKKVYITIGRLVESKQHAKILYALGKIKTQNFIYLIIGDGPERNNLEILSRNLELQEKVLFLGSKKNVFPYLSIADIFIYASKIEGFPNVLIEAICMDIPIITSNFKTGARECILGGSNDESLLQKIIYPYYGTHGVLLEEDTFIENLAKILATGATELINTHRQSSSWLKEFEVDTVNRKLLDALEKSNNKT